MLSIMSRRMRVMSGFVLLLLAIEFLDELVFGAREAAMPLIQRELGITYAQVGLLITLPAVLANFIEPVLAIWSDLGKKRLVILGGGLFFAGSLFLISLSSSYLMLLFASIILFPASGAFVGISQAVLMDTAPDRTEQNMARWDFAGSLGVLVGPLVLSLMLLLGLDWRAMFVGFGIFTLYLFAIGWMRPKREFEYRHRNGDEDESEQSETFVDGLKLVWEALKEKEVLRWLILLETSDMMLDILTGFKVLYLVNVVGLAVEQTNIILTIATFVGLLADFMLIYILERMQGVVYLRFTVIVVLFLYPAMLLVDILPIKIILLVSLGIFLAGWHPILKGNLYNSLEGRTGTALATGNAANMFGSLIPLALGAIADWVGLEVTMWLILISPILLLILLPRHTHGQLSGALPETD